MDCSNIAAAVDQNLLDNMTYSGGNADRYRFADRISEVAVGLHMEYCSFGFYVQCKLHLLASDLLH